MNRQEIGHYSVKKKGIMKKKKPTKFSSANTGNSSKKVRFSLHPGDSSIKNSTKKVNFSLDSHDNNNKESSEKPVSGGQSTEGLLCESPFVFQKLEGDVNIFKNAETGIAEVTPVANGVMMKEKFVQFSRGVLVDSENPYYLPIVDNHGFLLGEFSKLDDLCICDIEDDGLTNSEPCYYYPDRKDCKS